MGGGVNEANRLGGRGGGRGAIGCPRNEVVFLPDSEMMCKATKGVRPHKDNLEEAMVERIV